MKKLLLLAFVLLGAGQVLALTCEQCSKMNAQAQRSGSELMINCGQYCSLLPTVQAQNLSKCEIECMIEDIEPCCCPGSTDVRCD